MNLNIINYGKNSQKIFTNEQILIPSKYNVIIKNLDFDSGYLLFNTKTNSLIIASLLLYKNYLQKDTIINLLNIEDIGKIDSIKKLFKCGVLIANTSDEWEELCVEEKKLAQKKMLSLMIAPTLQCNMRCSYCFQQNIPHRDNMNSYIERELIRVITSSLEKDMFLNIRWFGGEPLLEHSLITRMSKLLRSACSKLEANYDAGVITNGVLLTKETILALRTNGISWLQVTLDGVGIKHDSRRPLVNGNSSFNKIIENIRRASEFFEIKIRINIDKNNILDGIELLDFLNNANDALNKIPNVSVYFHPVLNMFSKLEANMYSSSEFVEVYYNKLFNLIRKNGDSIITNWYPLSRAVSCLAKVGSQFAIAPDGSVAACEVCIGTGKHILGNIKNFSTFIKATPNDGLPYESNLECKHCISYPICRGGCPLVRKYQEKPCHFSAFLYPLLVEHCYREWKQYQETINNK